MMERSEDEPRTPTAIDLPQPRYESEVSVEECLRKRRSAREFADEILPLSYVSQLLWAGYGVTYKEGSMLGFLRGGLKTAPSAGALYPLDLYVVAGNVSDLPVGVYKYVPERHRLVRIAGGDRRKELSDAALSQVWIADAPFSIVYSAIFERNTRKYGERGRQRYVCMDLGFSAENVCLQAEALGLGTCAVGAFIDKAVKGVVDMTEREEPLLIIPVGRK